VKRARVVASRENETDVMTVRLEVEGGAPERYAATVVETLKLKGHVEIVPPGTLPNDGKVIEDLRSYG
jgi:phenylacetate-CoA ligase